MGAFEEFAVEVMQFRVLLLVGLFTFTVIAWPLNAVLDSGFGYVVGAIVAALVTAGLGARWLL